jgi:hypothetical protein
MSDTSVGAIGKAKIEELAPPTWLPSLGHCTVCGATIDLCDYPRPELDEYRAQYEEVTR